MNGASLLPLVLLLLYFQNFMSQFLLVKLPVLYPATLKVKGRTAHCAAAGAPHDYETKIVLPCSFLIAIFCLPVDTHIILLYNPE